jgi:uncharacterized protein YpiB (UPF0302 family)
MNTGGIGMFDKGYFTSLVNTIKDEQRRDILALIDCALDTRDYEWFQTLTKRLERVSY